MINRLLTVFFIVLSWMPLSCGTYVERPVPTHDISPYSFGLSRARNGIERYYILYNTHMAAIEAGVNVDYSGIKSIDLEIPGDAKPIPLSAENDFMGVVFNVDNQKHNHFLFSIAQRTDKITVAKVDIDRGTFKSYPQLRTGKKLLIVSDDDYWVQNREGHSYGHTRKDILLLEDGVAQNSVVMPYNNKQSSPSCSWCQAQSLRISNITLNRSDHSKFKTYFCSIQGYADVSLSRICIRTPSGSGMTSDETIKIRDCTNVFLDNIRIEGTYSRKDYSGYGFSMNNIWNLQARHLYGKADWGIFGSNNINVADFKDCDINRFDIHCYGRDISFRDVNFTDNYNQLASVFGSIKFQKCTFTDFCPLMNGTSYNAYVGYDLVIEDCIFNVTSRNRKLLDFGRLDNIINERIELRDRCLPNITIRNLTINVPNNVSDVTLMFFRLPAENGYKGTIKYLKTIKAEGIYFNYDTSNRAPANLYLSNVDISLQNASVNIIRDLDLIGNTTVKDKNKGQVFSKIKHNSKAADFNISNLNVTSFK